MKRYRKKLKLKKKDISSSSENSVEYFDVDCISNDSTTYNSVAIDDNHVCSDNDIRHEATSDNELANVVSFSNYLSNKNNGEMKKIMRIVIMILSILQTLNCQKTIVNLILWRMRAYMMKSLMHLNQWQIKLA